MTKFPERKNLKLLLDLGVITKDADGETACSAWFHLCHDPVVSARERNDPEPKRECDRPALKGHYFLREHIIHKFVAEEMTDADRAALRARLLARRVRQIPSCCIAPNEPLKI